MVLSLTEEILKELGPSIYQVGHFLLVNNYVTEKRIIEGIDLSPLIIKKSLKTLLQLHIVRLESFNETLLYIIDSRIIKKRLLYALYSSTVSRMFGSSYTEAFLRVLTVQTLVYSDGTDSSLEYLVNKGILYKSKIFQKNGAKKTVLEINYTILDQHIVQKEVFEYITQKFDKFTCDVYSILLTYEDSLHIDFYGKVINKLETKAEFLYKNVEKEQIVDSLLYLESEELVTANTGNRNIPFIPCDGKKVIKRYFTSLLLDDLPKKRLFNLILQKTEIDEHFITVNSLLPLPLQKSTIFDLLVKGLVKETINFPHKTIGKTESKFVTTENFYTQFVIELIEKLICQKMKKFTFFHSMSKFPKQDIEELLRLFVIYLIFTT